MLSVLENALIVVVVASIDAAIFLINPTVGAFALFVTVPLTVAMLLRRP